MPTPCHNCFTPWDCPQIGFIIIMICANSVNSLFLQEREEIEREERENEAERLRKLQNMDMMEDGSIKMIFSHDSAVTDSDSNMEQMKKY